MNSDDCYTKRCSQGLFFLVWGWEVVDLGLYRRVEVMSDECGGGEGFGWRLCERV